MQEKSLKEILAGDLVLDLTAAKYLEILRLQMKMEHEGRYREQMKIFGRMKRYRDEATKLILDFCERTNVPAEQPDEIIISTDIFITDKLAGACMFRGLLEFAKCITEEAGYEFAVREAVKRENLIGPISAEEEVACKLKNISLIRTLDGSAVYKPFAPEKPIIRFFVQELQRHAAKFRNERKRAELVRRDEMIRNSVSPDVLLKTFRGTLAFRVPLDGHGCGYVELIGDGSKISVRKAENVFEELRGRGFRRKQLPRPLFDLIRERRPNNKEQRPASPVSKMERKHGKLHLVVYKAKAA